MSEEIDTLRLSASALDSLTPTHTEVETLDKNKPVEQVEPTTTKPQVKEVEKVEISTESIAEPEVQKEPTAEVSEDTTSLVAALAEKYNISTEALEKLGIDVTKDDEDSLDSIIEAVSNNAAIAQVNDLFEQFPDVRSLLEHLHAGGTRDTWNPKAITNFSAITIDTDDIGQQKDILKEYYLAKGVTENKLQKLIAIAEEDGSLNDEAEEALKALQEGQKNTFDAQEKSKVIAAQNAKAEAEKIWKEIETTIDKGVLNNFQIPKTDLASFKEFVTRTDRKGYTARDIKSNSLSLEKRLLLDYIVLKDFKILPNTAKQPITTIAAALAAKSKTGKSNPVITTDQGDNFGALDSLKNLNFASLIG